VKVVALLRCSGRCCGFDHHRAKIFRTLTEGLSNEPRRIEELKIKKHGLVINDRHWSGGDSHTDSVAIVSDTPFATIRNGERIRIGGVEGFPESRLITGWSGRCRIPSPAALSIFPKQ
jgi:hypothetical protein